MKIEDEKADYAGQGIAHRHTFKHPTGFWGRFFPGRLRGRSETKFTRLDGVVCVVSTWTLDRATHHHVYCTAPMSEREACGVIIVSRLKP